MMLTKPHQKQLQEYASSLLLLRYADEDAKVIGSRLDVV